MAEGRLELLGAPIDPLTLEEALDAVDRIIAEGRRGQHASVNAAKVVRMKSDPELRAAVAGCELVTADGQPVVWASQLLGRRLPERVAGIDLMNGLLARATERGYRIYLLGARPDVVGDAAAALRMRHPGVMLAGYRHGYFSRSEEGEIVSVIAAARPDILFLALETPQKELFLARHRETLHVPFAMGVGGSLDVLAGRRRRAPRWAQRAGLEWAFRLAQEPRRLARRYAVGNARFASLVARELVRGRRVARGERARGRWAE
jgi:N-acetylglucosaminyldiphosphoundecaprenol N-acetyl-beta-D-mannosaminyltransferase